MRHEQGSVGAGARARHRTDAPKPDGSDDGCRTVEPSVIRRLIGLGMVGSAGNGATEEDWHEFAG